MSHEHIHSAFDRDLDNIQALILRMGGLVRTALRASLKALETSDLDLARKVKKGDREIDLLDEQVRTDTARVLALRAPTAGDLRTVLAVMAISNSLERCGDYARNIATRTIILEDARPIEGIGAELRQQARFVEEMIADALDAFVTRDIAKAHEVIERDGEADQMYNSLFRLLVAHMLEDPRNIAAAMHLHFIAKNIERAGDHATALAEQAIYLETGIMPDDDDEVRPGSTSLVSDTGTDA